MPITSSAKKALKVAKRKQIENKDRRKKYKSALKSARLSSGKEAEKKISLAYRELDMAAKKNLIHKNKASRLKSRLAKKAVRAEKPAEKSALKKTTKKAASKKTSLF